MREKRGTRRRSKPSRERLQLSELATRQHGVVSIRQLTKRLGYSRSAVSRAVEAGRLHRLYRGVFAVGHLDINPLGECLAAVLACGPEALLSHRSAAWLWGVSTRGPHPIEVIAANSRKARESIRTHRSRGITGADRALRERIPVTSLARTLLDCAAAVPFGLLQRYLERSEELRLFDLREVEELLGRTGGHPGRGPLRNAINLYKPSSFSRSTKEKLLFSLIMRAGLPQPRANYVECGYELDFYWPELRFTVELDLFETHGTRAAFERDRKRQEDLKLAGIEMVRISGRRLEREPHEVIARVARLLDQRADALGVSSSAR